MPAQTAVRVLRGSRGSGRPVPRPHGAAGTTQRPLIGAAPPAD